MVTTKLNLSMTEPQVRQIYAKQGDTGRVLDITLDQTPEDGTLRILRPDGAEVTSEAVTGGEVSGSTFESLTEADVTELTVGIEPAQDLNGYDKPWVGGAGKNKLAYPYTETTKTAGGITFTVNGDGSLKLNGTATQSTDFYFLGGVAASDPAAYLSSGLASGSYTMRVDVESGTYTGYVTKYVVEAIGNILVGSEVAGGSTFQLDSTKNYRFFVRVAPGTVVNNLVLRPMIYLASETDPTWQPYSNICPITGHDEVTVTRTGKNVIGEIVDGGYDANGETDNNQKRFRTNRIKCQGESYVTASWTIGEVSTLAIRCIWDGNGNLLNRTIPTATTIDGRRYYVTDLSSFPNASYIAFAWFTDGNYFAQDYATNVMVEFTNGLTAYVPYQGNTYTTSLGQTVYGGTLDMVTGVLTITHKMGVLTEAIIEGGGLDSGTTHLYRVYTTNDNAPWAGKVSGYPNPSDMKSNWMGTFGTSYSEMANNNTDHAMAISGATGTMLLISESSITSFEDLKSKVLANPIEIVYPLETPLEYQLTSQQIKTLVGTNNVWASSGDIVNITFTYGGLLSELPSEATEIVGKCYCDIEQNGVSSMPFTLNVKKNERES